MYVTQCLVLILSFIFKINMWCCFQTMCSVLTRLWNLQDNCQFYQNFFMTFFNLNKVFQDNLRNRWAKVIRPLHSWISGKNLPLKVTCAIDVCRTMSGCNFVGLNSTLIASFGGETDTLWKHKGQLFCKKNQ